jgi:hypothetical protein
MLLQNYSSGADVSGNSTTWLRRAFRSSWLSAMIGPLMERRREAQDVERAGQSHVIKTIAALTIFIKNTACSVVPFLFPLDSGQCE